MQEFYWIPLATILLAGVIRGIYASVRQVYGYSNPFLFGEPENLSEPGILPATAVHSGIVMFLGMPLLLEALETPLKVQTHISFIVIMTGAICLGLILLRKLFTSPAQYWGILISDGVLAIVLGRLFDELTLPEIAFFSGLAAGVLEIIIRTVLRRVVYKGNIDLFPLWFLSVPLIGFAADLGFPFGLFVMALASILLTLIIVILAYVVPFWLDLSGKPIHEFVTPLCILIHSRMIICNHCLRYSSPLASDYDVGRRSCEHCGGEIESTQHAGKVAVTFGNPSLDSLTGRVFILRDVQHELWEGRQIDLSEIYIETESCDPRLLERLIVHLLHTPPKQGIRAVKVLYQGRFEALPANLRNALHNNFTQVEPLAPTLQPELSFVSNGKQHVPQYKSFLNKPKTAETAGAPSQIIGYGSMGGLIATMAMVVFLALLLIEPEMTASLISTFYGKFYLGVWLVVSFILGRKEAVKTAAHPDEISSPVLKERLLIIAILGVVAAIAIPNILTAISRPNKQKRTMSDLRAIGTALGSYHVDYDYYPRSNVIQAVPELIEEGGFVPRAYYLGSLHDGWKEPYYYISNGDSYTLFSYGKDKKPGSSKMKYSQDIRHVNGAMQEIVD